MPAISSAACSRLLRRTHSSRRRPRSSDQVINKIVASVAAAMAGIKDGSTILIAGFSEIGEPVALIDGLIEQGARDLVVVHNATGRGHEGVARLIGTGRVRKLICSF